MSAYLAERYCIISLLVIAVFITCNNKNKKVAINQSIPMADTLKIEGCQDNFKTEVGSIVEIKLEAVPGSGYQWLLKDSSQLLQLLDRDSLKFIRPDTKQPTPGLPGHQILHFKAINKGEETLTLINKRVWETEILDTCVIRIEVN